MQECNCVVVRICDVGSRRSFLSDIEISLAGAHGIMMPGYRGNSWHALKIRRGTLGSSAFEIFIHGTQGV